MAVDVLQHDDGVVDHQADGEHQRQQRQRIDGEAEGVHQREGADQRDGNGDERDQRRPDGAEEEENDQDDENDGLADGVVDVLDRLGDEHRLVVGDADFHPLRQRLPDARQDLLHLLRHVEGIGRRLLDDAQRDGGLAVEADHAPLIERAELGMTDIFKPHEIAVGLLDDQVIELIRRAQVGLGENGELALLALDAAGRHLDILAPERGLDVLRRQLVGGEALRIEPNAHGIFAFAEQTHLGNAGKRGELILDVALGIVGDLQRRMPVAEKCQMEDRLGVGLDLLDDRLVDFVRQPATHAADPVAHVCRGIVGIAVELEAHGDLARFLPADRGDEIDALDA